MPTFSTLDFSFLNLPNIQAMATTTPAEESPKKRDEGTLKESSSTGSLTSGSRPTLLKLCNNSIQDVAPLYETIVGAGLADPSLITWIDLSCNNISIVAEHFRNFSNLQVVYLHGNKISNFFQLRNLARQLPALRSLTAHGNPVDEIKGYRYFMISTFPRLAKLDFSVITRVEREEAQQWASMNSRYVRKLISMGAPKKKASDDGGGEGVAAVAEA